MRYDECNYSYDKSLNVNNTHNGPSRIQRFILAWNHNFDHPIDNSFGISRAHKSTKYHMASRDIAYHCSEFIWLLLSIDTYNMLFLVNEDMFTSRKCYLLRQTFDPASYMIITFHFYMSWYLILIKGNSTHKQIAD